MWDAIKNFSLRNLVFALLLGIFCAASGAAIAMKQPSVYASTAQLVIDQPKAIAGSKDEGPIRKLAFLKIKYGNIAKGPAISGAAARSLGVSEDRVANSIVVTALPSDLLLSVRAQSSTANSARRTANAVATSIIDYVNTEQAGLGVPGADRYGFSFVQQAESATRVQPTANRALQAGIGLGVIAMVAAYVILQLLAPAPRKR